MNLLLVNDDGINARGIHELAEALAPDAAIYVCAPDGQRSASGHGITVSQYITVQEEKFECAEYALSTSGTPADCVKLGIEIFEKQGVKIDMVFSGINHGGNLGTDTLYSGTVSAAIEGSICGVPSAAVSVNSHQAEHFEYACHLAREVMNKAYGRFSPETVLNINTPNLPMEEIRGLRYTTLGNREYKNFFSLADMGDGKTGYRYTGEPVIYEDLPETIDVMAMQKGYASITPIHRDLTSYRMVEEVRKWRIE